MTKARPGKRNCLCQQIYGFPLQFSHGVEKFFTTRFHPAHFIDSSFNDPPVPRAEPFIKSGSLPNLCRVVSRIELLKLLRALPTKQFQPSKSCLSTFGSYSWPRTPRRLIQKLTATFFLPIGTGLPMARLIIRPEASTTKQNCGRPAKLVESTKAPRRKSVSLCF